MRDWNIKIDDRYFVDINVLILPIRDWNPDASAIATIGDGSFDPTYEGLKLDSIEIAF